MSEEIKARVVEEPNNDVDFKVNLSSVKKEEEPEKVEETPEVQEETQEVENKEEVVEEKPVEEKTEEPEQPNEPTKEEIINQYLTDKYKINLDSLEDVLSNNEKQDLPEEVSKYLEYKKETKRGLDDYVKLQQDFDSVEDDALLKSYYKQNNPGLDDSDIDFLINEKYAYSEDTDTESEIKKKSLEKKQELHKAREHFNSLKEKYKAPLESSAENVPDDYKEAFQFYNNYKEESAKQEQESQLQREAFIEKTKKYFNDDFKGFEFNINDKKLTYKPKNVDDVVNNNSDLTNFINKHVDDKGILKDAKSFHTALDMAMNPEAYAKFFYEQGKSDAVNEVVKDGKNINMEVRKNVDTSTSGTKFKVLQDTTSFASGLKIRKR
jgi:hypothetical protein